MIFHLVVSLVSSSPYERITNVVSLELDGKRERERTREKEREGEREGEERERERKERERGRETSNTRFLLLSDVISDVGIRIKALVMSTSVAPAN